jgi:PPK2 family polyphosphate:nucleotide phosphotransferase
MSVSERCRIHPGRAFRLSDHDPTDTNGMESRKEAKTRLEKGVKRMRELQEMLYAQDCWALLLIFQAMDAAGKDSTIEHVMSGVNPQGCEVYSFKAPSSEELDHDYMWRTSRRVPERGRIGIFNRSYYEEVLVVHVHESILRAQHLPPSLVTPDIWKKRYEDMNNFELYLSGNGVVVRKFFLNVSKDEQRRRFLARLDEPEKNWKFSMSDVKERGYWDRYMEAYEQAIGATSSEHAPWYVIPADHKWFMRMAVAEIVVETMEGMDLRFPELSEEKRAELMAARRLLEDEAAATVTA